RNENPRLRTTEQAFGDKLHTYTIVDAINDKNVPPRNALARSLGFPMANWTLIATSRFGRPRHTAPRTVKAIAFLCRRLPST
ncbi:MAG: hypothetical protein ACK5JT_20690, partial [Hyphomicrobiaceae bacterium]